MGSSPSSNPKTPADVLADLKARASASPGIQYPEPTATELEDLASRIAQSPQEATKMTKEGLAGAGVWVRELVEDVAPSLREDLREFLLDENSVVATELNTSEVNAFAVRAPNGGWLIVMNRGLAAFTYKVARALATHFRSSDPGDDPDAAPGCASTQIPIMLDWYIATGVPIGPDFAASAVQLHMANTLAVAAERFVLAHEIGHHAMEHLERLRQVVIGDARLEASSPRHEQEHEADVFAAWLVTDAARRDKPEYAVPIAWAGAELALRAIDMRERYSGRHGAGTHPPAAERLKVIRGALQGNVNLDEFEFVTNLADAIAELLELEQEDIFQRKTHAEKVADQTEFASSLGKLLERCATGPTPDHLEFRLQFAARKFEHTPDAICHGLAEAMDHSFTVCEDASSGDTAHEWKRLKLLVGLLRDDPILRPHVQARSAEHGVVRMLGGKGASGPNDRSGVEFSGNWAETGPSAS